MFSQKKILVVEDNPLNRNLLCQILASDYDVVEAANGQEALDVLERYGEGISLILLDIVMPVMDGDTFLSIVKANPAYSSIPVIVTTQNDGESDEIAALSHGAADFVAKPYRPQIILHRVAGIINLRETAAMINLIQYDRLTGLYSREFFYQQVKGFLLRNPARNYDLICSDIENFKLINDVFGIPAGNRLLCGVADMFRREVDGRGIYGRIHADQFICLLDRRSRYTDEMFLQANARVNGPPEIRGIVMKWGIYAIEDRSVSVENMCDRALLAARSIKGQYGKHFARYDDTLRNQLLKEQAIADSMESALEENQFVVYLQPKYRIKDESLIGAEALVRWDHPEWGLQSPAEFIPLFEKNGFITKLDQYVWDKACGILRDWDERGAPPISISVNVSRADIYNADLARLLLNIVQSYGLAPSRLHLEITESAYTENPRQIIDTVTHLRELGFVIEMDDFGSGHSSLNMLNEMPIDILKLDMKFIQSEILKPNTQGILQFVINLARWMRLSVVAEGVETRDQLRRLGEIGCDYVQGYYFGRPMPRADFEPLLSGYGDPAADGRNGAIPLIRELPVLLVADEDEKYRAELRDAFARSYQIAEAESGREALAFLEAHRETAAVVLSLTLPNPDGLTVLQTLREKKDQWDLPVLATAAPDAKLENESLLLGADDFVCKPHLMQSLLRRLRRVVDAAICRKKARLLEAALYQDAATGLLNQRGLSDALQALDQNDYPIAVYLFGLDSPPSPGPARGDSRAAELSMLLRAQVREIDLLAHIGEGEFLLLCKRTTQGGDAEKKGSAICGAVCDAASQKGIPAVCSAGAAILREGDSMPDWMEHIRRALRQAREQGPGSCRVWNAEQV